MENRTRSLIFKINEANIVDMATSEEVIDNYIQIADEIIFHKGQESSQSGNEIFELHQFFGFETSDLWLKKKTDLKFIP